MDDWQRLSNCPLFDGMTTTEVSQVLTCLGAVSRTFGKDQVILQEGSPASWVGIVLSGAVQIVRDDYDGNRSIVAFIQPPQLFAEAFACAGTARMPVSVLAKSDSRVLLLDCQRVLAPCAHACPFHARVIRNLLQVVADKNLLLHRKLSILSKRTTREKLMAYLMAQAKESDSREFTIPYDRQALADYLEVERSALSAEIGKLRKAGILDSRKSWFKI